MRTTIPQRELRNNVSDVLRRAEQGERFTITVSGRPVAELGPPAREPRGASFAELWKILADTPVDPAWADDLKRMREEDRANARDPWAD
ncbi:MAG TPA: type II toxin-antitoxin system prevent-host-death family antitoxin [Solirubrobacteraceae bacterium]|jgi:prevent-host-death family protein|nr:type II toxin-antitoxin system prevent-host-death family antitoxin [Solirubrobacteraceae bacterium]